jgi:drug/metabolite transporter (DMT)-like permease
LAVSAAPVHGNRNAAGIACLAAGIAIFSVQDLILKLVSGDYPLHQAMVLRSITAFPLLIWLVMRDGGMQTLLAPGWRVMPARGVMLFFAYFCYYLALAALPLATTVALYFVAPLAITMLSALLLAEKVGPRRWAAVAAGFAGVVVMLRPGSDLFEWAAVLPVVSGATYALSMVTARRLGGRFTAAAMAFWGNAVFLGFALLLSAIFGSGDFANEEHKSLAFLLRGWAMPTFLDATLMLSCGVIAAAGLTLLTQAYRIAEANAVAPFEYSALLWGVLFGWMFFGDWPDPVSWTGIAIIVGAGLYVLYRESMVRKADAYPPSVPRRPR